MALIDDKQEILQVSFLYVSFCLYLIHTRTHMQMLPEVLEGIEDMTEQVCQCVANVLLTCC
jgi:hypothetical protein